MGRKNAENLRGYTAVTEECMGPAVAVPPLRNIETAVCYFRMTTSSEQIVSAAALSWYGPKGCKREASYATNCKCL